MGLAPYGEPKYAQRIYDRRCSDLKPDGSFRMNLEYFDYCAGLTMTSPKARRALRRPAAGAREPRHRPRDGHRRVHPQVVTEEIALRCARHVHAQTGSKNLCLAGGVALNCVGNGRILREGPFDDMWIQPAAGDAGGALGVALFIWHQLLLATLARRSSKDSQHGSLLGPRYAAAEIQSFLDSAGAKYQRFEREDALVARVADEPASEKVIGWFQGHMEFGPRALGSRSILGDPRSPAMQSVMNLKIKFRESFRPFAPSVLEEHVDDYFETRPKEQSPYMLLVAPVRASHRKDVNGEAVLKKGIERLNLLRSDVPAITHVDLLRRGFRRSTRRMPRALLQAHPRLRAEDWLRCHRQHLVQRPWRADRVYAPGRLPLLPGDGNGRAGAGGLRAPPGGPAKARRGRGQGIPGAISARLTCARGRQAGSKHRGPSARASTSD